MVTPAEREIVKLLRAIAAKLGVEPVVVEKKPSACAVTSVTVESGTVREDQGSGGDVPSQLEHRMVEAGPMKRYRKVTTVR